MSGLTELPVHVYFGSQTGTAETFAHELADEANSKGLRAKVIDLEDFDPTAFAKHRVALLIVASTGDGDPTDNAVDFHKWLVDPETPVGVLTGVEYAVFGLGDRHYANFNRMGRCTDEQLERLGARRMHICGLGDDAGDIRGDFQVWKANGLWQALQTWERASFRGEGGVAAHGGDTSAATLSSPPPGDQAGPRLLLRTAAELDDQAKNQTEQPTDVLARFYFQGTWAPVQSVKELRQAASAMDGNSTVHLELDVSDGALAQYSGAGTLEVLPENDPDDVDRIARLLWLRSDTGEAWRRLDREDLQSFVVFVDSSPSGAEAAVTCVPFPTNGCTLWFALAHYCDLRRAPSRRMLKAVQPGLDADARERIGRLLADDWALTVIEDAALGMTQLEFWTLIGVRQLDAAAFLLHCPRQRARPFTIASAPVGAPGRLHLCVSLLSSTTTKLDDAVQNLRDRGLLSAACVVPPRDRLSLGLCSQWMCTRLRPGSRLLARLRPSCFELVVEDVPIVMIAAGAGVAPFRAFWGELAASARRAPAALFFGCRHPDQDWIYRSEMTAAAKGDGKRRPVLSHLVTAFSRQRRDAASLKTHTTAPGCGLYVQDRVREYGAEIRGWLAAGGVVYICGSTPMGRDVLSVLAEVLGLGPMEMQELRERGRIVQELWGEPPAPLDFGDSTSHPRAPMNLVAAQDPQRQAHPQEHRQEWQEQQVQQQVQQQEQKQEQKQEQQTLETDGSNVTHRPCPDVPVESVRELIGARRSIMPKDYSGAGVPEEQVRQLLDAARWAPSHGKTEPWRFVVFAGQGRERLVDATRSYYAAQKASFWKSAWDGEFNTFDDFAAHIDGQKTNKWLRCSHLISICMRRQQLQEGNRLYPEHEELAAVACAVHNMHLLATAMRLGAYWSSWFEHFTASPEGVLFNGLSPSEGDRWIGIFCIGQRKQNQTYRAVRQPVGAFAQWRHRRALGATLGDVELELSLEPVAKRRKTNVEVHRCPDVAPRTVLQLIEARRSIFPKDYSGAAVQDAQVLQLLDAARWAPSHGMTEPWRFVVFAGEGREALLDATRGYYASQDALFWDSAWGGEFKAFGDFAAHIDKQREQKWLRCSHLISICLRRQQPKEGKRLFPEHEEVAAVACAVQNMHLAATAMRVAAYWSSWFEHFTASPEGVRLHGLCPSDGDRWLGVFCVGQSERTATYRAVRRPIDAFAQWRVE